MSHGEGIHQGGRRRRHRRRRRRATEPARRQSGLGVNRFRTWPLATHPLPAHPIHLGRVATKRSIDRGQEGLSYPSLD